MGDRVFEYPGFGIGDAVIIVLVEIVVGIRIGGSRQLHYFVVIDIKGI